MSPADMGGVPQVMPTNDWWKSLADEGLTTIKDIAVARINSGSAVPAGRLSSNVENPAPGTRGLNFQAASTPGALLPGGGQGISPWVIVGAVAVLVVIVIALRR